jgi:hypothetical protein
MWSAQWIPMAVISVFQTQQNLLQSLQKYEKEYLVNTTPQMKA